MSSHAPSTPSEHAHPGAAEYIRIAVILSAITAVEVAVYYILGRQILGPILIALSAVKFSIVVMFYMHLKFDSRIVSSMFLFGLGMAAFTIIVFIALFHGLVHL